MSKKRENTDIGDFKIIKLPTVKKNLSLDETMTHREQRISHLKAFKAKRLRNSQIRVSRLLKKLEE